MKTRTRLLAATAVAGTLAVLTAVLLLSGSVSVAIWMEGPYFPLTLLVPGSVDTLPMMMVVVALYYFVASLAALKCSSWRGMLVVVSIVVAVNTLGALTWRSQAPDPCAFTAGPRSLLCNRILAAAPKAEE